MKEETGLVSNKWTHLGRMDILNGTTAAFVEIWLAEGVHETDVNKAEEDGIEKIITLPFDRVMRMVQCGEIENCVSVACIFRYYLYAAM